MPRARSRSVQEFGPYAMAPEPRGLSAHPEANNSRQVPLSNGGPPPARRKGPPPTVGTAQVLSDPWQGLGDIPLADSTRPRNPASRQAIAGPGRRDWAWGLLEPWPTKAAHTAVWKRDSESKTRRPQIALF